MVYEPSEDSYLFSEVLKESVKDKNISALDMGSGSGILAETLINMKIPQENITLADITKEAVNNLRKKFPNSKVIRSDLFSNINGKFDLIVFNPPYLPLDSKEPKSSQIEITGGKKGGEIISKFLNNAGAHLNKNGKIFLLVSSLTKSVNFKNFKIKVLRAKKLFFEELYVLQLEHGYRKKKNHTL